jgi:hypothetical protein
VAIVGTAVLRIVVSSCSMKRATATSQGRRRRVAAAIVGGGGFTWFGIIAGGKIEPP